MRLPQTPSMGLRILFLCLLLLLPTSKTLAQDPPPPDKLVAFHIDMRMPHYTREYLLEWLPVLRRSGYNMLIWEMTDAVRFDTAPDAAAPEAFSKAEFAEILAEARGLGFESVPLRQILGHAEYVLKHPAYAHLRDDPASSYNYAPLHPDVIAFQRAWIEEQIDLFAPVRYYHLGADEARLPFVNPKAQAYVVEHSVSHVFVEHVNTVSKPLLDRGIRPMIWNDMLLAHLEAIDELPREVILFDWDYYVWEGLGTIRLWHKDRRGSIVPIDEITDDVLEKYGAYLYPDHRDPSLGPDPHYMADYQADLGFTVITCGAAKSGGDNVFAPRHELHLLNTFSQFRKGMQPHLAGVFLVGWSHHMHHWELQQAFNDIPAFLLQNPAGTVDDYRPWFVQHTFGLDAPEFWEAAELLSGTTLFSHTRSLGYGMDIGTVNPHLVRDTLAELTARGTLGQELETSRARIADYRKALGMFEKLKPRVTRGDELIADWILAARLLINRAEVVEFLTARMMEHNRRWSDRGDRAEARVLLEDLRVLRGELNARYAEIIKPHRREVMMDYMFAPLERALGELTSEQP